MALHRRPRGQGADHRCHRRAVFLRRPDNGSYGAAARHTAGVADDFRQPGREIRVDGDESLRHLVAESDESADSADLIHRRGGILLPEQRLACRADEDVDPPLLDAPEIPRARDTRGGVLFPDTGLQLLCGEQEPRDRHPLQHDDI